MRTCHFILALPLLAATALAQGDKPNPKSPILVVNMLKAIDESDEGRAVIARLREEMATEKQRLGDEMTKLQEKVKQLREAKPQDRTLDYYKELEEAMETNSRLDKEKNIFMAKKGDELSRALQGLLQGAQQEARAVMKERGAEIVLLSKTGPIEVVSDQDFQQELLMRRILCFEDSIDITNVVIERMNDWYKKNKSVQGIPKREGEAEKVGKEPAKEKSGTVKEGDAGKVGKEPAKEKGGTVKEGDEKSGG